MDAQDRKIYLQEARKEEAKMKEKLLWHDALTENPKEIREHIVFIGSTNSYGDKYGFISFAKWCGHGWDRFELLDQDVIPHIVAWMEWIPPVPDGYRQED